VLYNIFGDTKLTIKNGPASTEGTIEGDTRMGVSFGGGARVSLFNPVDVSLEACYALNNIISPAATEEARNSFNINMCFHFVVH
jgi:hypothetical protein